MQYICARHESTKLFICFAKNLGLKSFRARMDTISKLSTISLKEMYHDSCSTQSALLDFHRKELAGLSEIRIIVLIKHGAILCNLFKTTALNSSCWDRAGKLKLFLRIYISFGPRFHCSLNCSDTGIYKRLIYTHIAIKSNHAIIYRKSYLEVSFRFNAETPKHKVHC